MQSINEFQYVQFQTYSEANELNNLIDYHLIIKKKIIKTY
jgi:hypothetical protein